MIILELPDDGFTVFRFSKEDVEKALLEYVDKNYSNDAPFMWNATQVKFNNDKRNPNDGSADLFYERI